MSSCTCCIIEFINVNMTFEMLLKKCVHEIVWKNVTCYQYCLDETNSGYTLTTVIIIL